MSISLDTLSNFLSTVENNHSFFLFSRSNVLSTVCVSFRCGCGAFHAYLCRLVAFLLCKVTSDLLLINYQKYQRLSNEIILARQGSFRPLFSLNSPTVPLIAPGRLRGLVVGGLFLARVCACFRL